MAHLSLQLGSRAADPVSQAAAAARVAGRWRMPRAAGGGSAASSSGGRRITRLLDAALLPTPLPAMHSQRR